MHKWWNQARYISIVVDNDSWILPAATKLVQLCNEQGDIAKLCRDHDEIMDNGVAYYLGCVKITPPHILEKNHRNLVVHASNLPQGRGMSPWTWQILEGAQQIPICLLEAEKEVDSGAVIYRDMIPLTGTELIDDLRSLISDKTIELCLKFLKSAQCPVGKQQIGEASFYKRRTPKDSELNVHATISEQFSLLRVVDNEHYPAFFEMNGQKYIIKIQKDERD